MPKFDGKNWLDVSLEIMEFLLTNADYFSKASELHQLDSFWSFFYTCSFNCFKSIYLHNKKKAELTEEEKLRISFYALGSISYVEAIIKKPKKFNSRQAMIEHCIPIMDMMPKEYRQHIE